MPLRPWPPSKPKRPWLQRRWRHPHPPLLAVSLAGSKTFLVAHRRNLWQRQWPTTMTKPVKHVVKASGARLVAMAAEEKVAVVAAMDAGVNAVKAVARGKAEQRFAPRTKLKAARRAASKDAKPMSAPHALIVQNEVSAKSALPARVAARAEPSHAPKANQKAEAKHSRNSTPKAPKFVKSVQPARAAVNVAVKVAANVLSVVRVKLLPSH